MDSNLKDGSGNPITSTTSALDVNIKSSSGGVAVNGTVAVSNFPTTQPINGTVTANQGTANATPWKVDGSGVTQPVSGTVTVQQATAANLNATITGNVGITGTPTVNIAAAQTIAVTQATAANLNATVTGTVTANDVPPSLTKGTQGSTGFSVQDLKDAGRTYVTFTLDAVAGVTSEALATMAINRAETTSSATSYTVTTGKTLRIQSISASITATTTTALTSGKVRLRTAASAISITSPVLVALAITPATAAALAGACAYADMAFPDGIEVASTHQIAISQVISSASSALTVTVIGYEY